MFSSILRARSENQNSKPDWSRKEAKITTSTVGTAAMTEKSATRRVWSRALPMPCSRARLIASLRDNSTISAIAGSRLATSSKAISSGGTKSPGAVSRRSTPSVITSITATSAAQAQVA